MNTKVKIKIGNRTLNAIKLNEDTVMTKKFSVLKMCFIETHYITSGILKTAEII